MKIAILFVCLLAVSLVSAYDGDACNSTYGPCSGGCTSTNLQDMFSGVTDFDTTIGDITGWNTSCVTSTSGLFKNSDFNQNIGAWDTSIVDNMGSMFESATSFNQPIGGWNTSQVTDMNTMFSFATAFNQDIGTWDVSLVTDFSDMFYNATSFNQDIGLWYTVQGVEFGGMFANATAFNQDIGGWDVSSAGDMHAMFMGATAFNQDISSWDVISVESMSEMFAYATSFNQDIGGAHWHTNAVTDLSYMFAGATAFNQDISTWYISKVTTAEGMFDNACLDTVYYDSLITGWGVCEDCTRKYDVLFSGGTSKYTADSSAGRTELVDHWRWIITDGGLTTDASTTCHATPTPTPAAVDQCASIRNARTTLYAGFGLFALMILAIAAFIIIQMINGGNADLMTMSVLTVSGAVVILIAYVIIYFVSTSLLNYC